MTDIAGETISAASRQIFNALVRDASGTVDSEFFIGLLERHGLQRNDPRMVEFHAEVTKAGPKLTLGQFNHAVKSCATLVHRAVQGRLRVPDFKSFKEGFEKVYADVLPDKSGDNADYIPQLATVDPEQFAISVTTIDGQHFSIGDADTQFCIQSCSKPISYLIGLQEFGQEYVHKHVGTEPSGHAFNEMILKDAPTEEHPGRRIPHNPCINAGAIMAVSMVYPGLKSRAERHARTLDVWKKLSGGDDAPIGYDDATYKSESGSADRNWCLGYMMKERHAFPPCFESLEDTLELYFQLCSTLSTSRAMSIMAATLANGGLNPLSGERVFSADHVRSVLPIMLMAGMYDYSGQWAYDIGVPAKSGVGGCVFVVIPNVCGIAIWSPRLDSVGNSARGVHAATKLTEHFQFHSFEVFSGLSRTKIDPVLPKNQAQLSSLSAVLFAAAEGDVAALMQQHASGVSLFSADYDARTALHLAATEGHAKTVEFLISVAPSKGVLDAQDRWGGTALTDAKQNGHTECAELLAAAGCTAAKEYARHGEVAGSEVQMSAEAPYLLYAASIGDVDELIRFAASGESLTVGDYDLRTALHLAASNGHAEAVSYLIAQAALTGAKAAKYAKDRYGNTPRDDATRGGHADVAALFD